MRTLEGSQTEAISNLEEKRETKPGSVCLQVPSTSFLSFVNFVTWVMLQRDAFLKESVDVEAGGVVCKHKDAISGFVRCRLRH